MSIKINKLTLQNFKAYKDKTVFDFGGKNVLIFGTNGSGKSSLYKALRYLFKSSVQNLSDIQKHFSRENAETIKNIYADAELASYVTLETIEQLSEGNEQKTIHTLSKSSLANVDTIKTALSLSEFINYRLLFNFSQFGDYEDANIFDVIRREFFPIWFDQEKNASYERLNNDDIVTYEAIENAENISYSFEEWYLSLEDELSRLATKKTRASSGREYKVHPTASAYTNLKSKIDVFNSTLRNELIGLTRDANTYLSKFLKRQDIKIHFTFETALAPDTDNKRHWDFNRPIINLSLKKDSEVIKRPHIFLNEARLTALAFAIRLAAFKRRLQEQEGLKVFVLDDILMSMDMSNRYLFFDFILTDDDLKDYQKIILTHERDLYEMLIKMVEIYPNQKEGEWKQFELYENGLDKDGTYENPTILTESLSHYDKAKAFFEIKDYPSCGNYQRKAIEQEIQRILKDTRFLLTGKGTVQKVDVLHTLFERLEDYCKVFDFDNEPFKKLGVFSKIVLNKLSHDNLRSIIFRDELNLVFDKLQELKKLKKSIPAKKGEQLIFEKQSRKAGDGKLYKLVAELKGDFIVRYQQSSHSPLRANKDATITWEEPEIEPIELWIDGRKKENPTLAKTQRIGKIHAFNLETFLEIPERERQPYEDDWKIERNGSWISLRTLVDTVVSA